MNGLTVREMVTGMADLTDEQRRFLLSVADTDQTAETWLEVLARFGREQVAFRRLASRVASTVGLPNSAQLRILAYLKLRVGTVVGKDEISGVAGIYEWGRRVRELRVEEGWVISSNANRDDLDPGQYVLEKLEQDMALRERWQKAHRIRRVRGSATSRILRYFQENVGGVVSKDELRYVSRIQEHPRRVRELVEAGWQIDSNLDRKELRPGEYLMVSATQLPSKAREHIKLRFSILDRDRYRCCSCGAGAGQGRRLQIHHLMPLASGGTNDRSNLETLCDACHAGKHAMLATDVRDELLHPEAERGLAQAS